ncbi:type IV secretion system protein [Dyella sp.]|uniref:virB8 family protein n=1 Tax=Dyella sp. TaxID=1869338 RepID=UPI002B476115|nr:type IV secretion system protein [Dyella sp.]
MFKRTSSQRIDDAVAKSINYEITVADLAKRSERRAWLVAFSALVMSLILAGGYFYMLPLKEKVPYIIMADAYTGTSTITRLTDDVANHQLSTSEAINRSNVAHFILARESYDVAMMNLRDWTATLTMSSPEVAAPYRALHAPNNPNSPYATYGKDRAIRIKILSITLIGGSANQAPQGATVRFQRSLYNKQTGASQLLDNKIANLQFTYKSNLQMDEQARIENPLGFQVTSYRVDNDYATAAPDEVRVPEQADPQNTTAPAVAESAPEAPSITLAPEQSRASAPMATPRTFSKDAAIGAAR